MSDQMHSNTLSLGFSPCPNDTFLFDALIHQKINTEGLLFEHVLEDVESLNRKAFDSVLDITKLSFFAYGFLSNEYQLLDAGAALGYGVGPLLISKKKFSDPKVEIKSVAIPGKYTTANFLFSLFFPDLKIKNEMHFSLIEDAVLKGQVDAGVIIHENRFTYADKGLHQIVDLGSKWEEITSSPIPLGGIAVRRSLSQDLKLKINSLVQKSVEYAIANPLSSGAFVKSHAQEMHPEVIMQHIGLYVNNSSIDIGNKGRDSIYMLYEKAKALNLINTLKEPIFLEAKEIQKQY
ncbi:MAG TPA: 1,4-dihydroxy-6-naphthoate synthase [Bacteroidia bacterium]|nr:1,4-dihydroxy-6-naphthoate synthase [Bacteroidia bacterium]